MPSFYFRVRTPDRVNRIPERVELPNLEAALAAGSRAACGLVRGPARRARTLRGSLDIENEGGQPIARLMLAEVAARMA